MGVAKTPDAGPTTPAAHHRALIRAVVACGITAGGLALLAAALIGLRFIDRHFSLSGAQLDAWDQLAAITDTALFVVLYLVVPPIWAALTIRWWVSRGLPRGRLGRLAVIAMLAVGVFAAWAWLATALRHIEWVFGVEPLPPSVITVGISDVDRWEALVVAGLLCLVGLVAVNVALMLHDQRR